jgi:hypothetical protein
MRRDAYQSQQGMMVNDKPKNSPRKFKYPIRTSRKRRNSKERAKMKKETKNKKETTNQESLLRPKAGALSRPSHKIRVPPTCGRPQEIDGLIIRAELLAQIPSSNSLRLSDFITLTFEPQRNLYPVANCGLRFSDVRHFEGLLNRTIPFFQ